MVQSTPQDELIGNELIKEFAERARQAHRSIQDFINSENPAPDESTMLTLIETSEQLGIAMNKHQRAMLQARKAAGHASANTTPQPQTNPQDPFSTATMQNALPASQPQATHYGPTLSVPAGSGFSSSQSQPQRSVYDPYPSSDAGNPQPYQQNNYMASEPPRPGHQREASDLYGPSSPQQSPPTRQTYDYSQGPVSNTGAGRFSPVERQEDLYHPPPGPPPPRRQQPQSRNDEPVEVPAPEPNRYGPQHGSPIAPTATRDYDVSENPFADDNAVTPNAQVPALQQQPQYQAYQASAPPVPEPRKNPHSIFNRAAGQLRDPQSPTRSDHQAATAELDSSSYPAPPPHRDTSSPTRPAPGPRGYHENWQPTPSFVHRQDSSTAHITMSGASPPPDARQP